MPAILEAAGLQAPSRIQGVPQQPLDGVSRAYTFADATAAPRKRTKVFEMMENLGIYKDGWWAGTVPGRVPWNSASKVATSLFDRKWELNDIDADVVLPRGGGDGVFVTQGGMYGGYAFCLRRGRLVFHNNATGPRQFQVARIRRSAPAVMR